LIACADIVNAVTSAVKHIIRLVVVGKSERTISRGFYSESDIGRETLMNEKMNVKLSLLETRKSIEENGRKSVPIKMNHR
jgi:hypothetical protein